MKILFLSQVIPYPTDAGPKTRAYYCLRHLHAVGHQVVLVYFSRPADHPQAIAHLQQFCSEVISLPLPRSRLRDGISLARALLRRRPFIIERDSLPQMHALVQRLLDSGSFDAVHSDQLWMAQYARQARQAGSKTGPLLVLDEHNACFQIVQRLAVGEGNRLKQWILQGEARKVQAYEARCLAQFDRVVTVTQEDRRILEGLASGAPPASSPRTAFETIPICVDPQQVRPAQPTSGSKNVLHLGTMFWPPNAEGVLWFARKVWPQVQAQIPQATFTIVGKNPPEAVRALAASGKIEVTGFVQDPQPYLDQAAVFIVPLFSGSGMRVKILDAWSWGLPIVSTSIGAEGLEFRNGENILIADSAQEFAQAVLRLLQDEPLAARLRQNGRDWVSQVYDWRKVYPAWDALYPPPPFQTPSPSNA